MKHLKLFFALFAMLALGVSNAWGAVANPYVHNFASGEVKTTAQNAKVLDGVTWSISSATYVGFDNTKGVQIGSGNNPQNSTAWTMSTPISSFGENIQVTKVEIAIATASSGGVTYTITAGAQKATATLGATTTVTTKSLDCSANPVSTGTLTISLLSTKSKAVYIKSVKVTYETASGTGETVVKTLQSIEVTPKTVDYETGDVFKFDGTCTATYSVTKNGEPQDDETAVVTPTTVSTPDMSTAGTKEITVTYTEDGVTVTDTYEINVTENVVTPGTYTGNLNNVFFGCATGNIAAEQSGKFNDVLVVAGCKSTAQTKTNYQSGHVRFYADSYLTLSVPTGYVIKSIVFTADGTWNGSITASAGTYTDGTKTWAGNAQEVKFSFAQQNRIKSVKVTYAADVKYALNITTPSNGTLVVKEGETEVTSGATFPEGTKLSVVADPAQGYKLDSVTVVDESSKDVTTDVYADGVLTTPAFNITISAAFSENEKPDATLTLSKNGGVTEDITGYKQDDKIILPSITGDCVKEFVGWSPNPTCNVAPGYKADDEYTLAETTQTLYAVYATVQGGGEATASVDMATYAADNGWTNEKQYKSLQIDANVTASVTGGGNTGKYYTSGNNWRLYQTESATITISTTLGELKSVKFTFTNSSDGTLLYNSTALTSNVDVEVSGNSAVFTVGDTHATENKGQIRISKIEIVYTGSVTYSDYSTTCSAALANPTFSLAEGKYTEAKSVEIEYTEGTVYYTMDGTEPTISSKQYTGGAIALNDCGEYTIKAIAISSDSQSDVVSATYTIKLPLTNSQAAPYTEAEAIAVYDDGCYDNQDVYVKGTVKTATFNSTYGNYTITLTNGFQFYRFLQAAETKFTEDIIVPGDVLVACGKLSKYNTTYQLAEGCYLVERIPYEGEKTDISNTEATAYTVDQAFALIADVSSDLTKEVFVKGLVAVAPTSNPTADGQMTYKISDNGENTGNVLTVYLGLNLNGEKFTSKNDVQQGDYVVVKGKLLNYNSTYELNKGNQLVQHLKAATITIADITMEVGETKTISATINPDAAKTEVAYSIKAGSDDCITLSENNITAKAEGTATIVATIATAEGEYMGKTVEFKVTVNPVASISKVIILAQYGDEWYAMTNVCTDSKQMGALKVNFQNGVLYDVAESDKASITWELSVLENKATFKNSDKYLIGGTSTTLNYANSKFEWVVDGDKYLSDSKTRSFMYNEAGCFKNYAISNVGKSDYSGLPVVTAPVYVNSKAALTGKFSTGEYEYAEFAPGNLQYNVGSSTWAFAANQYDVIGEPNINVGDPTFTGTIDMFGWSADGKFGVNPSANKDDYAGDFVDWGTLFPAEDNWSTLSKDQWDYLLNQRGAGKKQIARVGTVFGVMLFPDEWTMPSGISVTAQYDSYFKVNVYNYTLDQWTKLENAGALFMPAAGRRFGGYGNTYRADGITNIGEEYKLQYCTNDFAAYWTSTKNDDGTKVNYLLNLGYKGAKYSTLELGWVEYGHAGHSVRLAKVTSTLIEIGDGDNSAVITANANKTVNVKLDRPFNTSGWGTLCVPFEMSASVIGEAYELGTITKHQTGEGINLNLAKVETIEAGKPYLIKANVPSLDVIKNVTIVNTIGSSYTVKGDGIKITFTGLINGDGQTNGSTEYYVGADDGYLYNAKVDKLGLRALFTITDEAGNPTKVRARVVVGENTTTGFENITNGENTTIKVIENGQLVIIRNGEKFNAQGVKF